MGGRMSWKKEHLLGRGWDAFLLPAHPSAINSMILYLLISLF